MAHAARATLHILTLIFSRVSSAVNVVHIMIDRQVPRDVMPNVGLGNVVGIITIMVTVAEQ